MARQKMKTKKARFPWPLIFRAVGDMAWQSSVWQGSLIIPVCVPPVTTTLTPLRAIKHGTEHDLTNESWLLVYLVQEGAMQAAQNGENPSDRPYRAREQISALDDLNCHLAPDT
jgi:hypothetical protein